MYAKLTLLEDRKPAITLGFRLAEMLCDSSLENNIDGYHDKKCGERCPT